MMRTVKGRALCEAALLGVLLGVAPPLAAEGTPPVMARAPEPLRVQRVELAVLDASPECRELAASLSELLGRLSLAVVQRGEVEQGDADALSISVRCERGDFRVAVRAPLAHSAELTAARDGSSEVRREELAHRAYAVIESWLLPGGRAGRDSTAAFELAASDEVSRSNPAPPEAGGREAGASPVPVRPESAVRERSERSPRASGRPDPETPRLALDVNTSLGVLTLSSASGPVALFGAGTTLRRTARDHAGLSLDVRYVPPVEVGDSVVSARVQTLGGRFGLRLDLLQSERLAWGVALGAGADLVSVAPRSARLPEAALAEPSARLVPVLSGAFELRVRAAPSTSVLATVGGDVDGAERRWVIEEGRREAELFTPSRLRLLVSVGFEFTVAGGARLRTRGGP